MAPLIFILSGSSKGRQYHTLLHRLEMPEHQVKLAWLTESSLAEAA